MIIGISGKIGSGKGAIACYIAEEMYTKQNMVPIHGMFAKTLKEIVEKLTCIKMNTDKENYFLGGITDYTQEQKNIHIPTWDKTIGQMLQIIGTEVFRDNFDENTWIKTVLMDYEEKLKLYPNLVYVVSDLRFPNEADFINSLGGYTVRVTGDPAKVNHNSTRSMQHISETALDDYTKFTSYIENNGTLQDLQNNVKQFCNNALATYNLKK